jgi:hypothetical protein
MAGRVFSDDDFVEDEGPSPRFDMRTGQAPSLDPLDAAIKRRAAGREKTGIGETALLHGAQGGSFGLSDELTGAAVAALDAGPALAATGYGPMGLLGRGLQGVRRAFDPNDSVPAQAPGDAYRAGRDSAREDLDQTAEDHAGVALAAQIGGSLMNPIKLPVKGPATAAKGFMPALGRMGVAGLQGAAQGGAQALGTSRADLTRGEFIDAARDTGAGMALGGGVGVAGQGVIEGARGVGGAIAKNLKKRVVNEFAEGLESKTTPTQQQHLNRAQDDIYAEVSTGPDAKAVRGTVYKGAAEGREILKPIVDKVGAANKENYAAFTKAGRDQVDTADYMMRLASKADEADQAGDTELFEAINGLIDDVDKANARGPLTLTRLRGMTTKVQKHAASAVGGLNTHAAAELEGRLMATATEAMDDSLGIAAQGVPELEAAAQSIRANNRRIYALKTVDKGLKLREYKEGNAPGLLVRGAKAAATPGALAAGAAIAGDDESRLENALYGAAAGAGVRGLVPLAKLAQRGITSAGIKTQLPGYGGPTAEGVGRAIRPFVPPLSLSILQAYQRRREQEK